MAEMIRLGAYLTGSDPVVDSAISLYPALEDFLSQGIDDSADFDSGFGRLYEILAQAGSAEEAA